MRIVAETEDRWMADRGWPQHPNDADARADLLRPVAPLYDGTAGVCRALPA